jgi:predicted Zn-dependent protease
VGGQVAAHAHRKLPYSFYYVPDPHFVNAFALPGGPVFIGGGLIALMDSEDELATVLGHEIEHIDHYHCAERVQIEARTRRLGLGGLAVQIPIEVFAAGYTKEQELEADAEGTRLAVSVGYSPLGSIRMFEAFDRAYHEDQQRKASSPQAEVANVALQTIEGYFRSHPPSAERAERIRTLMAQEHWAPTQERDIEVGWAFWTVNAERLLSERKYSEAQAQAARVLKIRPTDMKALHVMAEASLKQGDFATTAGALRHMLEQEPHSLNLTYQYAHALAGLPNHARAAREFEDWISMPQAGDDPLLKTASAGLHLLAGDERPAKAIVDSVHSQSVDTGRAARIGYLGWWYYLAGRYDIAANLLADATNMLPGNKQYVETLGWTSIEQHRYADALRYFRTTESSILLAGMQETAHDPAMSQAGIAVALWLGDQHSEAVAQFQRVYDEYPEWRNAQWVRAMYSATVWRTVSQMSAEIDRERKERLRASGHPQTD